MLQGWRLKLRQAELAVDEGRLEEAARLLFKDDLRSVRQGKRLARQVAVELAGRAHNQVQGRQRNEAWRNLDTARALAGDFPEYLAARDEFITKIFSEIERSLQIGDSAGASTMIEELERHGIAGKDLDLFKDAAQRLESAKRLVALGKFEEADVQLVQAASLLAPQQQAVEQKRQELKSQKARYLDLQERLRCLVENKKWNEAAETADRLLDLAPANAELREAKRQVGAQLNGASEDLGATVLLAEGRDRRRTVEPLMSSENSSSENSPSSTGKRFLMWVDAVGGFLVCLDDEVMLGQATPGNRVDLPIFGDLSRRHARIVRQGGAYIIEPFQPITVEGRLIASKTLLSDGDELELGAGVRLRFRQPHALSATARLDFISRHRTQPTADAILLMAESCVMGPTWRNHVVCREWSHDVVIFRHDNGLFCRSVNGLIVDGQQISGRGRLSPNSRIVGGDFSMSLEELDKWTI